MVWQQVINSCMSRHVFYAVGTVKAVDATESCASHTEREKIGIKRIYLDEICMDRASVLRVACPFSMRRIRTGSNSWSMCCMSQITATIPHGG